METLIFSIGMLVIGFALYKIATLNIPKNNVEEELKQTLQLLGQTKQQLKDMTTQYTLEAAAKKVIREAYEKVVHQKKSSEVRVGQTVEQLVGFLEDFPYPDAEIKAMYQPVDLIVFKEDEIVFIEIKSGESQLSDKQRKIRDLIEEKKVRFEVHRINGKGYKVK